MPKQRAYAGLIEQARLRLIPEPHWIEHEYCFCLHDYMVTALSEFEKVSADGIDFTLSSDDELARFESLAEEDVLGALETLGYKTIARRAMHRQLALALYADMLHFIHDGLIALEKRKFSVALALFRKPLKENLFFAAWLCGDEDDFHNAFGDAPDLTMDGRRLQPQMRRDVFKKCISKLEQQAMFDDELLYAVLYDKGLDTGLANVFDKATHLVTGSKPLLRTEARNLNFIFKSPLDNDIYQFLYMRLAYVMIFAMMTQYALFNRLIKIEAQFVKYSELVAVGCHNLLYADGRAFKGFVAKSFGEFANCPHCKVKLKFSRLSMARLLMTQDVTCHACGNDSQFPLFWLMSKVNWELTMTP